MHVFDLAYFTAMLVRIPRSGSKIVIKSVNGTRNHTCIRRMVEEGWIKLVTQIDHVTATARERIERNLIVPHGYPNKLATRIAKPGQCMKAMP